MAGIVPGIELMTPVASHVTHRALEWLRSDRMHGLKYLAGAGQLACAPPNSFDQVIALSDTLDKPEILDTYFHVADARGLLNGEQLVRVWLTHQDYLDKNKITRVCRRTVACEHCAVHLDAALQVAMSTNDRYVLYLEEKFQMNRKWSPLDDDKETNTWNRLA